MTKLPCIRKPGNSPVGSVNNVTTEVNHINHIRRYIEKNIMRFHRSVIINASVTKIKPHLIQCYKIFMYWMNFFIKYSRSASVLKIPFDLQCYRFYRSNIRMIWKHWSLTFLVLQQLQTILSECRLTPVVMSQLYQTGELPGFLDHGAFALNHLSQLRYLPQYLFLNF